MENLLSTPTKKPKKQNFSPHKLTIVFLGIGVAVSLIFAFLFYIQSKDWQNQFSKLAKEHNKLAGKVFQIAGALKQDNPQAELENQENNKTAVKKEEPKPAEPISREAAIISAIEKANPAVASIIISKDAPKLDKKLKKPEKLYVRCSVCVTH